MTPRRRTLVWSAARHALLLCGAAFVLLPFLWMISTASKPQTEIFTTSIHFIPQTFALWAILPSPSAKPISGAS
jgi:multiple sugar transport system permease protein